MATVVSMKALLESGVHFGHRTNKWNPRMKPVHLHRAQRHPHYRSAANGQIRSTPPSSVVRDSAAKGGTVLFVGTKRQAQETVKEEAMRCGMPYVTERWLGGMLTNWVTIYERINELERWRRCATPAILTA